MTFKDGIATLGRALVGGVLIYAGFMKAMGPSAEFAAIIEAYKILPPGLITPLSIALPYAEMWVGLFVLSGCWTRYASACAMVLFGVFIIAVGSALLRGLDLESCGCFGANDFPPKMTILLDTGLLALSTVIFLAGRYPLPYSVDQRLS